MEHVSTKLLGHFSIESRSAPDAVRVGKQDGGGCKWEEGGGDDQGAGCVMIEE